MSVLQLHSSSLCLWKHVKQIYFIFICQYSNTWPPLAERLEKTYSCFNSTYKVGYACWVSHLMVFAITSGVGENLLSRGPCHLCETHRCAPWMSQLLEPAVERIYSKKKKKDPITNTCELESLLFLFYNFLIWYLDPGGHRRCKGQKIRKGWKTTPCPFPPLQGSGSGRPELRDWGKALN